MAGFQLVPSTFAFGKQADVQYFLSNEGCEVDGLAVTASAWLNFRHRKSVPRAAGSTGLTTPPQDLRHRIADRLSLRDLAITVHNVVDVQTAVLSASMDWPWERLAILFDPMSCFYHFGVMSRAEHKEY